MFTSEIKASINQCVLCWLATSSDENVPNVSPKEAFTFYGDSTLLIANIASPQTTSNIQMNPQVCVSFVDVFVQKGYQMKGIARIIRVDDPDFKDLVELLEQLTKGKFPFKTLTSIEVQTIKPIIAPSYRLFPDLTEEDQIASAKRTYGVQ